MAIAVQQKPFDLGASINAFSQGQSVSGAVVSFTGIVRDLPEAGLKCMLIEHYPSMTEKVLTEMAQQAQARWHLDDVMVLHRYGELQPGEAIMMVATAAQHRKNAFEAANYLMDYLKSRAPFWKKEITQSGAEWVAAKDTDEAALDHWSVPLDHP